MHKASFYSACRLVVGVALVAVLTHTWFLMGLVSPVVVDGSSMVPALNGPHRNYRCDACGRLIALGLDQVPSDSLTVCPYCNKLSAHATSGDLTGDRLLVDRTAFALREPRRWEVVVFRSPSEPRELCVKRVVGLPGETVALAGGDVLIDGKRIEIPAGLGYTLRYGDADQLRAGWHLGPAEYFVLGDNAEISDDSRSWPTGAGLPRKLLVGKPLGVR